MSMLNINDERIIFATPNYLKKDMKKFTKNNSISEGALFRYFLANMNEILNGNVTKSIIENENKIRSNVCGQRIQDH